MERCNSPSNDAIEAGIMDEIREIIPPYLAEHAQTEDRNRVFEPFFVEMHRRASLEGIGVSRFAGGEAFWTRQNTRR
jgi:5-methylthioadenosine/S-adenosylhomocysteine deaminase